MVKNLPANAEDTRDGGSIPGLERVPRNWQPTPVSLPVEFHVQRSLACCSPGGAKGQTQLRD